MTPDRDFARLDSHLQSSWLIRGADALATTAAAAASGSTTAQWFRSARDRFHSTAVESRVRAVGVFLTTATIGHLLLLRFVPAHIAPALPKALWVLVAVSALVIAIAAKSVAHAWRPSLVARLSAFASRSDLLQ